MFLIFCGWLVLSLVRCVLVVLKFLLGLVKSKMMLFELLWLNVFCLIFVVFVDVVFGFF